MNTQLINIHLDEILVTDLHLVLTNEAQFYEKFLLPLYKVAEKKYKKGLYDMQKFVTALQDRIRQYLNNEKVSSYYKFKCDKDHREAVARKIALNHFDEMSIGNFLI